MIGRNGPGLARATGITASFAAPLAALAAALAAAAALLGVALELAALAAIRDDLTLNVLMLVHPVDAVRAWQAR